LQHTCGITTADRAVCWGRNDYGQLGRGTTSRYELIPLEVAGNLAFVQLASGYVHTCGVASTSRRAYCWGDNEVGQLGNRTKVNQSVPVAVAGDRQFRLLTVGGFHTCAVTAMDRAFCWGSNRLGQLGDGTSVRARLGPKLVAGGWTFRQLDAGGQDGGFGHTCGITTDDRALCWGHGLYGQLGDGTQRLAFEPSEVAGGLNFDRLSAGDRHTCGETADNRAYCWGRNVEGQLGDGTTGGTMTCPSGELGCRSEPVAVTGGRRFRQVTSGSFHTCGLNASGVAFCWGANPAGQLGDGTTIARAEPTEVADQTQ
jgi:alpha-tubulin suppressor-like RCC1 family protein